MASRSRQRQSRSPERRRRLHRHRGHRHQNRRHRLAQPQRPHQQKSYRRLRQRTGRFQRHHRPRHQNDRNHLRPRPPSRHQFGREQPEQRVFVHRPHQPAAGDGARHQNQHPQQLIRRRHHLQQRQHRIRQKLRKTQQQLFAAAVPRIRQPQRARAQSRRQRRPHHHQRRRRPAPCRPRAGKRLSRHQRLRPSERRENPKRLRRADQKLVHHRPRALLHLRHRHAKNRLCRHVQRHRLCFRSVCPHQKPLRLVQQRRHQKRPDYHRHRQRRAGRGCRLGARLGKRIRQPQRLRTLRQNPHLQRGRQQTRLFLRQRHFRRGRHD